MGLFLLLCFPPREVSLAFVVKLIWWCWTLLAFACPNRFWFLCQIWMSSQLGNLGCRFLSFTTLRISYHSLLACRVSAEKSAEYLMGIPLYVIFCFSRAAFNVFSLNLSFVTLVNMCLYVFFLRFILYGTLCASWTWVNISFPIFGKFSTINSSNIFSDPSFSLLLLGSL